MAGLAARALVGPGGFGRGGAGDDGDAGCRRGGLSSTDLLIQIVALALFGGLLWFDRNK